MATKEKRRVRCDPVAHKTHLCYLLARRRAGKARALVGDGRYTCTICRRQAASAESVCDPRLVGA